MFKIILTGSGKTTLLDILCNRILASKRTGTILFNGKENIHLNKIKESVITSIDVNYSPNGWAAHDDGTPVQTTMTVQFKEIELVDRNAVNQGY